MCRTPLLPHPSSLCSISLQTLPLGQMLPDSVLPLTSLLDLSLSALGFFWYHSWGHLCVSASMLAQPRDVTELIPWVTLHQERSRVDLAGSGFLLTLSSMSFSELLYHLVCRISKGVEEWRQGMQKSSTVFGTQQIFSKGQPLWWQDCRQQSEDMEWLGRGSSFSWNPPLCSLPLCPTRNLPWMSELNFLWHFPFSFLPINGNWSIKSHALPTAFITAFWRNVGI